MSAHFAAADDDGGRRAGIQIAAKREHDKFVTRVFRDIHQIERMPTEAGADRQNPSDR